MLRGLFVFFLALMVPSISHSTSCHSLFSDSSPSANLRISLNNILLNDQMITSLHQIRIKYADVPDQLKSGATIRILPIVYQLTDLPYTMNRPTTLREAIEVGIDFLLTDLVEISPEYLSTKKLLEEDIAYMTTIYAAEYVKETQVTKDGNVVSIPREKVQRNADYREAKKHLFSYIDGYSHATSYIPKDVMTDRVEQLLGADLRVQMLAVGQRSELANRIIRSFENTDLENTEAILEKFFATRPKVRL